MSKNFAGAHKSSTVSRLQSSGTLASGSNERNQALGCQHWSMSKNFAGALVEYSQWPSVLKGHPGCGERRNQALGCQHWSMSEKNRSTPVECNQWPLVRMARPWLVVVMESSYGMSALVNV